MVYAIEYLAKALKAARENKKLSQRALSQKIGMPQAHISKIENAAVDLRASNLVELARALDLEVMLVPRKHVPAVNSLIGSSVLPGTERREQVPAYRLDAEDENG
ncbi:MAG TPA: XRE family transcriptional regulator [Sedimenticola sp.]|nr:XRE family transcriptional regulator [Sedimenticola sp.]